MPAHQVTSSLQSSASVTCMKLLLTIFNIVFWISGVIVLIVGIWTQWELQQYIKLSQLYYETTPYVLIGVGVAIIVVATLGCCCTIRGYGRLLYMYGLVLMLIFIVQLTVAISAFVYRTKVEEGYAGGLTEAMNSYKTDSEWRMAVDSLQTRLQCCGHTNYTDWFDTDWSVPRQLHGVPQSCCIQAGCNSTDLPDATNTTLPIYTNGCFTKVTTFVESNFAAMGGVAIGFAFLQLFGALLSCCLGKHVNKNNYELMV